MMTSHTNGKSGLTLVGLAAGAGSRFGGPKQLEPFGPRGETMLDFAVHDALDAGFDTVVLVVRREMGDAFERGVIARWGARVPIALAFQEMPEGRKPWGTVDAVLAAEAAIAGGFAVVNADDYYGPQAYRELAGFLRAARHAATDYAVVGFPLRETMSESGGVTRALLRTSADGWLEGIEEIFDIERAGAVARGRSAEG
jgi:NDP-sugar pyrophosphorylase family protein